MDNNNRGESSSSSDDEEQQHLIHQNHHTFQIDNHNNNKSPRHPLNPYSFLKNKRYYRYYLLAAAVIISLVLILLLFFTSNFSYPIFTTISNHNLPDLQHSDLRALSLLKQQQSLLVNLLSNRTNLTKSALLEQISLNNRIQQALLSNSLYSNDNEYNATSCRKVENNLGTRRTIEWKGKKEKYLFAICTSGQMSNHLICLEKHMFFAAVLGRVLVIPSAKVDYEFSKVLDIDHINKCVGREVVVTFEEFVERKKGKVRVDKVLCYFSLPQACYVDEEHVKKLRGIGVSVGELESVWRDEDVKKPSYRTMKEVVEKFTCDDEVLAIGDVFFADVEKEWVMQPGGPIAHTCQTLIEPSRVILLTAQRFIQTFLGKDFVALHFRRHGFLKFCNAKNPSCFFPIPQAAECISRLVERANIPVIYLSTDAAESETGLLQSLITLNGKTVPLITRPARNSAEKWDALLYRKKLDGDTQVEAMLDKTISALSGVFIGAPGSTFTEDILRLRRGWGTASVCDEYLCQGEVPNFIAGDE